MGLLRPLPLHWSTTTTTTTTTTTILLQTALYYHPLQVVPCRGPVQKIEVTLCCWKTVKQITNHEISQTTITGSQLITVTTQTVTVVLVMKTMQTRETWTSTMIWTDDVPANQPWHVHFLCCSILFVRIYILLVKQSAASQLVNLNQSSQGNL